MFLFSILTNWCLLFFTGFTGLATVCKEINVRIMAECCLYSLDRINATKHNTFLRWLATFSAKSPTGVYKYSQV